jgi:hypothetical protein
MKITKKLISFLHRVFEKDPAPFLALRLRYAGAGMTWKVDNARLTTTVVGGSGAALSVDLTQYTLGELVNYLASRPGYTVEFADNSERSLMGGAVLLDGTGDQALSNGDHLYGYTSVLWSYMEANAVQLQEAAFQIEQMLRQMSTVTANDVWLDELGSYYAVPRLQGEQDPQYSLRIIAEVLRPRGNNVAIEAAISAYTGQTTKVTDVTLNSPFTPLYDGSVTHNSAEFYNSTSSPLYGLFDVEFGYDIVNGGDISAFAQIVRDLIGRLRDAGTHLRSLSLQGSELNDDLPAPTDDSSGAYGTGLLIADTLDLPSESITSAMNFPALVDAFTGPQDGMSFDVQTLYQYNGIRAHNGAILYVGSSSSSQQDGDTSPPPE